MVLLERARRVAIVTITAAAVSVVLSGCVGSAAVLPPALHKAPVRHVSRLPMPTVDELAETAGEQTAPAAPVDVASLLGGTQSLGSNIEQATLEFAAVRHALTLAATAFLVLGVVIAGLLVAVLAALNDMRRAADARLAARAQRAGAARNNARALPDSRRAAASETPAPPQPTATLPRRAMRPRGAAVRPMRRHALGPIVCADSPLSRSSRLACERFAPLTSQQSARRRRAILKVTVS